MTHRNPDPIGETGRAMTHHESRPADPSAGSPHPLLDSLGQVLAGVLGTAMCLWDAEGRLVARSPAAEALAASSVQPPEAPLDGESQWQGWLERPSGGWVWAEVRTTPLQDAEGTRYGFLQVLRDETGSRAARAEGLAKGQRAEDSQRRGERLLSRARRMARHGGWEWNAQTRELQVSDEMLRVFGLPAGKRMSLDDWYGQVHPEDVGPFRQALESALETGGGFRTLLRVRRPDGVERVLLCDGDADVEDEHFATGLFGTVVDLTGRRMEQAASAKSERDLQAVRAQPEAILYTDTARRIVEANPAAERLFGISLEELTGRDASELLGSQASEPEAPGPAEFEFRARDGRTFSGEWVRVPVDDASGRILGTLWMITDVSARRRAEERLAEARRHLAASREAERGILARQLHDGPIQDLIALSYQLAHLARTKAPEAPEAGRMRGQVLEVVQRLRSLIAELRPPGLAELGLEAALEGLILRLQPELPRVELDLRDCAALSEVRAVCLFRAVQEALQNVSRHAEARTVHVRLRRAGDQMELSVRDDGRGFQVPDSLQALAQDQHFGLVGLAERAELAGGTLAVRSQPGHGTELCLTLPLVDPADV